MSQPLSKTLICIACGGLNDSLATIGKCFDLCFVHHKYEALIICDAYSDGLMGQLKQVFEIKGETRRDSRSKIKRFAKIRPKVSCSAIFVHDITKLQQKINSTRKGLTDRTDFPQTEKIADLRDWILTNSINVDSPTELNKECHLFVGHGGGAPSRCLLRALRLKPKYGLLTNQILSKLPRRYDSIHVRNTDMQTDYKSFFESIKDKVKPNKKLVICSDDSAIQAEAAAHFGRENIFKKNQLMEEFLPFLISPKPNSKERLHNPNLYKNETDKEVFVARAIADLFCLAGAENLFFSKLKQTYNNNDETPTPSGYSLLAEILKKDPSLLGRRQYIGIGRTPGVPNSPTKNCITR